MSALDALNRLRSLTRSDRDWIISNLSATARDQLLASSALVEEARPACAKPSSDLDSIRPDDVIAALEFAPADSVLAALRTEQAWCIAALLRAYDWRWRDEVLNGLSARMRADVEQLEQAGLLTQALGMCVARQIAPVLRVEPPASRPSGFEELVGRFAALRARKRMTIRL